MTSTRKAGILLATLLVPALLYLFLRFGTQNHYVLPRYLPKIDSTKGEPLMGKVRLPNGSEVTDTIYNHIPPFKLIDQDGKLIRKYQIEDYRDLILKASAKINDLGNFG